MVVQFVQAWQGACKKTTICCEQKMLPASARASSSSSAVAVVLVLPSLSCR